MTLPITSHMAAEGVDADLPAVHRSRMLSRNAAAIAVCGVVAEVVLNVLNAAETEAADA